MKKTAKKRKTNVASANSISNAPLGNENQNERRLANRTAWQRKSNAPAQRIPTAKDTT
jgi:hypothetical protein